ncbi:MAG: alpha/beta hydrolase [Opitutaceae bacterium]
MKYLSLIAGLTLACASQAAEYTVQKDIAYLGADRQEKMDAYIPSMKFPRPLPVVIWIHGGGWSGGSKSGGRERNICQTLAENGYAAFSIDYLVNKNLGKKAAKAPSAPAATTEQAGDDPSTGDVVEKDDADAKAPWPQNFYDCKSALRFIRKERVQFGIDPARIAVSGGSAGGHLALMLGTTANDAEMNKGGLYTDQSNRVSCILDFYGASAITEQKRIIKFAGKTPEETKANAWAASPVNHLGKDTPPTLILHGTKDGTVSIKYSRDLAKRMEALAIPYQFIEIPGAGHSFDLQPKEMDLRPAVLEFLAKYLGKDRPTNLPRVP